MRAAPVRHVFTHRTWMWLVDIDLEPDLVAAIEKVLEPATAFDPALTVSPDSRP